MSVQAMEAVFQLPSLGPSERLILLCLADHADESGTCWPSIQRLSERSGMSTRNVVRVVQKLSEAGYLTTEKRGGRHSQNVYWLHLGGDTLSVVTPCHDDTVSPRWCHPVTTVVTPCHLASDTLSHKPSRTIIEPSGTKREGVRGTRLPPDWSLPDEWRIWALDKGHPPDLVHLEAEKFRDHWISASGQSASKRDWQATWRNWMRRVRPTSQHRSTAHDTGQQAAKRRLDAFLGESPDVDQDPGGDHAQLLPFPGGRRAGHWGGG